MSNLRQLFDGVTEQMRIDFEKISTQVPHMGVRGGAREDSVRRFLTDYLPERIGVGTGIIIDHAGQTGPQTDVVLYDRLSTPVFKVSDTVRMFPAETVIQTIEVKSTLTKTELGDALDKVSRTAALAAPVEPQQALLAGFALSQLFVAPIRLTYHKFPVMTGIFAFDSVDLQTLVNSLLDALDGKPRSQWPSFVVSLTKGAIAWGTLSESGSSQIAVGPYGQTHAVILKSTEHAPLPLFYTLVLQHSQVALSARPDIFKYLSLGGGHLTTPLPPIVPEPAPPATEG